MRSKYRRYVQAWSLAVCGAVFAIGSVNWIMDPYRLFGAPLIDEVNTVKPELVKNDRAAKTQMILRVRPDALILGNSRSLNGIPTRHPAWRGYTVFNGALTAGRIDEAYDILRFAHASRPIRRVLLNIDELDYRSGTDPTVGANPDRYRHDAAGTWARAMDRAGALITDRGLRASLRTWNARYGRLMESDAAVVFEDGSVDQEVFYRAIANRGGARLAFRRVEAQAHSYPPDGKHTDRSGAEATLLELLRFARRNGIEITIYFPPVHARALAEKRLSAGLEELFEIRRSVVGVALREAQEAGRDPVRVFDFMELTAQTAETIPPPGDSSLRMTWFFEGSHFTQHFGSHILDHIYVNSITASSEPVASLPLLAAESNSVIDPWVSAIDRWISAHADEVQELPSARYD